MIRAWLLLACSDPPPPPAAAETPPLQAPAAEPEPEPPPARGRAEPLPAAMRAEMVGVTWREGCPVPLEELSLLTIPHWDFAGERQEGRLIAASRYAEGLLDAFEDLYEARYPVHRMRPVEEYGGSDDASMADNNTSAFNCRPVTGSKGGFSEHSYGHALDLNPVQNPYVRGSRVLPPAGAPFVSRPDEPGVIHAGDAVVRAFAAIGWSWGGGWKSAKDYQHFSRSGR